MVDEQKQQPKPVPLFKETYLALVRNSIDTVMFRSAYGLLEGKEQDLLHSGELSCAYFVSFVLKGFDLVTEVHFTVAGTVTDMGKVGWEKIELSKILPGSVIVWESQQFDDDPHKHIGFSVGNNKAISTSYKLQKVVEHDLDFNGQREIEAVHWNRQIDSKKWNVQPTG